MILSVYTLHLTITQRIVYAGAIESQSAWQNTCDIFRDEKINELKQEPDLVFTITIVWVILSVNVSVEKFENM